MKRYMKVLIGTALASLTLVGTALADFTPDYSLEVSDTTVGGHPQVDIHLAFDAEDEEIGNYKMTLPKGFDIAADEDIENGDGGALPGAVAGDEEIGAGNVVIRAGFDCRPGPEGAIPVGSEVTIPATIYEKARTDAEADDGVHAVWLLDLEPANRVRLLVKGSITEGWTIEGAPTPSDNTCNPLTVDLTINSESESGVPIITNPLKKGKKVILSEIFSQDSPAVATFKTKVKITP